MTDSYGSKKRDWKPSMEDDPITVDIEKRLHIASEIDTRPADIESLETYENRIGDYKSRGFTYIPMPGDGKYYNTEEGWLRDISSGQYIDADTHLMEVLRLLQEEPFLLIDTESSNNIIVDESDDEPKLLYGKLQVGEMNNSSNLAVDINSYDDEEDGPANIEIYSIREAKTKHPELSDLVDELVDSRTEYDEERYGIITLADINRRGVKMMIYVVFSGLVSQLSHKIEQEYPASESIFKYLKPATIGRWYKTQKEGIELHVAEQMNLVEIMQVIQASNKQFVKNCGFESKRAVEDLNSINDIRNRVMHANRSLIYDRRDIQDVLSAINRAQEIVENID